MDTPGDERAQDHWLTVAEFADALRVRPVTVRSWIAKGQLKATRAGQRKWLIRRSELSRMLDEERYPPPDVYEQAAAKYADIALNHADADHQAAEYEWGIAVEQSRMAPPDARFSSRIRHIAEASARFASSLTQRAEDPSFAWRAAPGLAGMTLSHELRPGGNRPGPPDAWERFDRVVARLGMAMEGTSASAVATALADLSAAMNDVADAIDNQSSGILRVDDGGVWSDLPATERATERATE